MNGTDVKKRGRAHLLQRMTIEVVDWLVDVYRCGIGDPDPESASVKLAAERGEVYQPERPTPDKIVKMFDAWAHDPECPWYVQSYYRDATDRALELLAGEVLARAETRAGWKIRDYETRKEFAAMLDMDVHDVDPFRALEVMAKHPDVWQGFVELKITKAGDWTVKFDHEYPDNPDGAIAVTQYGRGTTPMLAIAQAMTLLNEPVTYRREA